MKVYQEQHDRHLKRAFGASLVKCYLRLIEVVSTGKKIIKHLDFYLVAGRSVRAPNDKEWWDYWFNEFEDTLRRQSINLERLINTMGEMREELCVFAPEVAELLPLTATRKQLRVGRLWALVSVLRRGELPIDFLPESRRHFGAEIGEYEAVQLEPGWNQAIDEKLFKYLDTDNPIEQLNKLQEYAKQLHQLIIQHFKVEEILYGIDDFHDDELYS